MDSLGCGFAVVGVGEPLGGFSDNPRLTTDNQSGGRPLGRPSRSRDKGVRG